MFTKAKAARLIRELVDLFLEMDGTAQAVVRGQQVRERDEFPLRHVWDRERGREGVCVCVCVCVKDPRKMSYI